MGLLAGISAFLYTKGKQFTPPPPDTCIGGLLRYITTETKHFQPMNVNFGLLQDYKKGKRKRLLKGRSSLLKHGKSTYMKKCINNCIDTIQGHQENIWIQL